MHVIADSVYTYEGDLNLQVSAELDAGKGCRANAEKRQGRKIVLICKKKTVSNSNSFRKKGGDKSEENNTYFETLGGCWWLLV